MRQDEYIRKLQVLQDIRDQAPIVVECRHDPTLELPVFEIQDRTFQLYRPDDLRALTSDIENIQNQLLNLTVSVEVIQSGQRYRGTRSE
jgi:hypothetical protein